MPINTTILAFLCGRMKKRSKQTTLYLPQDCDVEMEIVYDGANRLD
jgi:hypothetical protein